MVQRLALAWFMGARIMDPSSWNQGLGSKIMDPGSRVLDGPRCVLDGPVLLHQDATFSLVNLGNLSTEINLISGDHSSVFCTLLRKPL